MFKLVATFTTSLGKKQTWSLNNPDPNKTPTEVKSLLQRLIGIKLFHKDGADLSTQSKAQNMWKQLKRSYLITHRNNSRILLY